MRREGIFFRKIVVREISGGSYSTYIIDILV